MSDQTLTCIDQLNDFARFLSIHPGVETVPGVSPTKSPSWPQPMFWTKPNCTGQSFFPQNEVMPSYLSSDSPPNPPPVKIPPNPQPSPISNIQSFFIPPGWSVSFFHYGENCPPIQFPPPPTGGSDDDIRSKIPYLLSEVGALAFDCPTSKEPFWEGTRTNVAYIYIKPPSVSSPAPPRNQFQPTSGIISWKYNMCMNNISTMMGAEPITAWSPGSPECDDFMTNTVCLVTPGTSVVPPVYNDNLVECDCLIEEQELRKQFCEGNPIFPDVSVPPGCSGDEDDFGAFIPVTCYGKKCSSRKSYKLGRMLEQKCNITLCEQNISILGQNITASGGSTLWCGNRYYATGPSTSPSTSPSVSPSATSDETTLPEFIWIIIGVAGLLLFVALPLAIVTYSRAGKNVPSLSKLIASPVMSEPSSKNTYTGLDSIDSGLSLRTTQPLSFA